MIMIDERRLIKKDMKFKKIISVLASAVMLSSTIAFAAAASFPEPFVSGGTANGAVVYGVAGDITDLYAAIDIQTNLQGLVTTSSDSSASVSGTAWQVKTSSDILEIGESFQDITTYIDDSDLPILSDGSIANEKGTSTYEQFLYWANTDSQMLNYTQDSEDNVGLFLYHGVNSVIARYVIDFTSPLKSDVTSANRIEDIEDKEINILGKTYVITKAENSTATDTDITLMSGAAKGTVNNDEEVLIGGRTVSVVVSATNAAQFTIDGETTTKLAEGDTELLSDGTYLGVSDITYESISGGLHQATIYLGADKIFLEDSGNVQINAETIDNANVSITETYSSGDVSITQIDIYMSAEDDLYTPEGGKLSETYDLDEPEVLLTQNWDIIFSGFATHKEEEVKLYPTGSDKKYELVFNNYDGDTITFPLFYTNNTGLYPGKQDGRRLVLSANGSEEGLNITKNDYFILNTANPATASNNARTYILQYKTADKTGDSSPKVTFDILGVENGREMTLDSTGTFSLKLGGSTFNFKNASQSAVTTNNFNIVLTADDYVVTECVAAGVSCAEEAYLRTEYNALINITDLNATYAANLKSSDNPELHVTIVADDATRDDDDITLSSSTPFAVRAEFTNGTSSDATATITMDCGSSCAITDAEDTDKSTWMTKYGILIDDTDPSGAPATVTVTIPESILNPLIYVTSGEVTITPGSAGGGGQILVVKDSEVSSVSGKNLVVVGGSCINTVAAKILGSDTPLCEAAFTDATEVSAGQYIIKTVASPYAAADSGKVAMLVAGYNAADTTNAVAKALEGVTSDVDTSQVYPITST